MTKSSSASGSDRTISPLVRLAIPVILAILGACLCASVPYGFSFAQMQACSVPSSQFINQAACENMVRTALPMSMIWWGLIGAFGGGVVLGLMFFVLSGMVGRRQIS